MNKICHYCAEEIKEEAIKCKFCHSMLSDIKTISYDSEEKRIKNYDLQGNNKSEHIVYIISSIAIFTILVVAGLIMYFYGSDIAKSISNHSIKIETDISKKLKEENNNFRFIKSSENKNTYNITYDYKIIYKIDITKLLNSCGENNSCYDKNSIKLNPNAPFIIKEKNKIEPKTFIINFVNIPNQNEIIKAKKDIFEKFKISFGDSLIVKVKSVKDTPLKLTYQIPKLNFEVTNKTKNPKKTIILGIDNNTNIEENFAYEEKKDFFTKKEFDIILDEYIGSLKGEYIQEVELLSFIKSSLEFNENENKTIKYHNFIINSKVIYPIISYGRTIDEKSCLSWKNVVVKHNNSIDNRYKLCINEGKSNCNRLGKWSLDYKNYYTKEIKNFYPKNSEKTKVIGLNIVGTPQINNSICKSEIDGIINTIKTNLISN